MVFFKKRPQLQHALETIIVLAVILDVWRFLFGFAFALHNDHSNTSIDDALNTAAAIAFPILVIALCLDATQYGFRNKTSRVTNGIGIVGVTILTVGGILVVIGLIVALSHV